MTKQDDEAVRSTSTLPYTGDAETDAILDDPYLTACLLTHKRSFAGLNRSGRWKRLLALRDDGTFRAYYDDVLLATEELKALGDFGLQLMVIDRAVNLLVHPEEQGQPLAGVLEGFYSTLTHDDYYRLVYEVAKEVDAQRLIVVVAIRPMLEEIIEPVD